MSEFKHLLPLTSTKLERDLELVMARSFDLGERDLRKLKSPQQIPAQWLPWLAWERRVSYWKDSWAINTQRDVVDASISVHRRKGTLESVRLAIRMTGLEAVIAVPRERVDYVPHSFCVTLDADSNPPTPANAADIRYQVDQVKPARCAYTLAFRQDAEARDIPRQAIGATLLRETVVPDLYRHRETSVVRSSYRCAGHVVMREAA